MEMTVGTFVLMVVLTFVVLGVGIVIGRMIERNSFKKNRDVIGGVIHVDYSDPDGPYLFLELDEDVDKMVQDGYLKTKVQKENYISQE